MCQMIFFFSLHVMFHVYWTFVDNTAVELVIILKLRFQSLSQQLELTSNINSNWTNEIFKFNTNNAELTGLLCLAYKKVLVKHGENEIVNCRWVIWWLVELELNAKSTILKWDVTCLFYYCSQNVKRRANLSVSIG